MALRSSAVSAHLRSVASRMTGNTSTNTKARWKAIRGDYMPVCVSLGLITLSVSFGIHTAMHQLSRSPNVSVSKKRREMIREVVEPERVVDEAEQFINKSFFRKVAHVQDSSLQDAMPDAIHKDAFAWKREPRAVTLKDVGVDPIKSPGFPPVHPARLPEIVAEKI